MIYNFLLNFRYWNLVEINKRIVIDSKKNTQFVIFNEKCELLMK